MKLNSKNLYDYMGGYFYKFGRYIDWVKLTYTNNKITLINKETNVNITGINNIIKEINLQNYEIEKI